MYNWFCKTKYAPEFMGLLIGIIVMMLAALIMGCGTTAKPVPMFHEDTAIADYRAHLLPFFIGKQATEAMSHTDFAGIIPETKKVSPVMTVYVFKVATMYYGESRRFAVMLEALQGVITNVRVSPLYGEEGVINGSPFSSGGTLQSG